MVSLSSESSDNFQLPMVYIFLDYICSDSGLTQGSLKQDFDNATSLVNRLLRVLQNEEEDANFEPISSRAQTFFERLDLVVLNATSEEYEVVELFLLLGFPLIFLSFRIFKEEEKNEGILKISQNPKDDRCSLTFKVFPNLKKPCLS